MRFKTESNEGSEIINISSMIDVLFILIIFFLVTTTFKEEEIDHLVNLPTDKRNQSLTQSKGNLLTINIRENGAYVVMGTADDRGAVLDLDGGRDQAQAGTQGAHSLRRERQAPPPRQRDVDLPPRRGAQGQHRGAHRTLERRRPPTPTMPTPNPAGPPAAEITSRSLLRGLTRRQRFKIYLWAAAALMLGFAIWVWAYLQPDRWYTYTDQVAFQQVARDVNPGHVTWEPAGPESAGLDTR